MLNLLTLIMTKIEFRLTILFIIKQKSALAKWLLEFLGIPRNS